MKIHLLCIILSYLLNLEHDVPIAIYNLTIQENNLKMEIQLDKDDFEMAIITHYNKNISRALIEDYIHENAVWIFNGKQTSFDICTIHIDHEHYTLKGEFSSFNDILKKLEIYNTCLIHIVPDHSNIIYIHKNEKQRGFRLHKKRIKTVVELE